MKHLDVLLLAIAVIILSLVSMNQSKNIIILEKKISLLIEIDEKRSKLDSLNFTILENRINNISR